MRSASWTWLVPGLIYEAKVRSSPNHILSTVCMTVWHDSWQYEPLDYWSHMVYWNGRTSRLQTATQCMFSDLDLDRLQRELLAFVVQLWLVRGMFLAWRVTYGYRYCGVIIVRVIVLVHSQSFIVYPSPHHDCTVFTHRLSHTVTHTHTPSHTHVMLTFFKVPLNLVATVCKRITCMPWQALWSCLTSASSLLSVARTPNTCHQWRDLTFSFLKLTV